MNSDDGGMMTSISCCIMCDNQSDWVRCTQFAGDHPFCDSCAHKEEDFGEDDSYLYWIPAARFFAK